jgi:hypothetical protein
VSEGNPIGRPGVAALSDGSAVVSWLERTDEGIKLRVAHVRKNGVAGRRTVARFAAEREVGIPVVARSGRSSVLVVWTRPSSPSEPRHLERAAVSFR